MTYSCDPLHQFAPQGILFLTPLLSRLNGWSRLMLLYCRVMPEPREHNGGIDADVCVILSFDALYEALIPCPSKKLQVPSAANKMLSSQRKFTVTRHASFMYG